jgi:hypothetical protein
MKKMKTSDLHKICNQDKQTIIKTRSQSYHNSLKLALPAASRQLFYVSASYASIVSKKISDQLLTINIIII